ncbi:ABC-type polysaccharide/polyol phosphate transport system [Commensalibacter communis]|uniref:ABC transporter ATP-binding protein n=1 Tax=Commensalibacter communis TaxID=2972786 RepID=UPI0022FFA1BA|nr:ABC transporter ATP-binding protein [Commensalibacter communis]CAI3951296.1 ABC-type polysaccharide/polyol phosphate transport system [Commensalibacter communis]CAI3953117.1 ABC-type polysaccharide/polyol phosphate transport system [Commensalibacter communis]
MNISAPASFIKMEHLSIEFPVFQLESRSLKKTLFSNVKKMMNNPQRHHQRTGAEIVTTANNDVVVQALRDINLTIQSGERVGLIGHNGAGKSTLLRAITGIYEPNSGHIQSYGHIEALLSTNAGMNPLLSGRENIYLRGKRLGLSQKKIQELAKDVETFAELNEFIELPIKIYSSGMLMRLGFGLSTSIVPNILLMDEWFMAGDSNFQEKARNRLVSIVDKADILVLTTHSLSILQQWCSRLIWLKAGQIIADGPTDIILDQYERAMTTDSGSQN